MRTWDSNCCFLRRVLSLGRVKEYNVLRCQDLKILRSRDLKIVDCEDLRDCRIFRGGGGVKTTLVRQLSLPKSHKPGARQSFKSIWIVWSCETVAYSEGVGVSNGLKGPTAAP